MYVTIKCVPIIPESPAESFSSETDTDKVRPLKWMALLVLHFEGTGRFCVLLVPVTTWISGLKNTNTLNIVLPSTRMFSRPSMLPSTLLSTCKELRERLHHFKQIMDESKKLHYIYDFTGSKNLKWLLDFYECIASLSVVHLFYWSYFAWQYPFLHPKAVFVWHIIHFWQDKNVPYMSLFLRYKFSCFFKRSILWVLIFVGVIFRGYELCAHGFVYSAVRGYNKFYNQYKEIWGLFMERKGKFSILLLFQWWKIKK